VLATLLLAAAVAGPAAVSPPVLECGLTRASRPGAGPLVLTFTLRNTGAQPLAVLDWQTPLEGLLADVFEIRLDGGEPIPYRGPMIKRGDPSADDYVVLGPGEAASGDVEPGLAYDLGRPGRYRIALRPRLHDVAAPSAVPRPRSAHQARELGCPALEIELP
jgi:peptidyl-Lys metalloendopeptidase